MARFVPLALALAALCAPFTAPALSLAPAPEAVVHVHMGSGPGGIFTFDPPLLQVLAGTTLEFHVHNFMHSATSGVEPNLEPEPDPLGLNLNAFDTGTINNGGIAHVTLNAAGDYAYYCKVATHRTTMRGLIQVQ